MAGRIERLTLSGIIRDLAVPGGTADLEALVLTPGSMGWAASHTYDVNQAYVGSRGVGAYIHPAASPSTKYLAYRNATGVSGGSEPSYAGVDGTCTWQLYSPDYTNRGAWVALTAYLVADVVHAAGFAWLCGTAGTSGGSTPAFAGAPNVNDSVSDGTAEWLNLGPYVGAWAATTAYAVEVDANGTPAGQWVSGLADSTKLAAFGGGTARFCSSGGSEPDWTIAPASSFKHVRDGAILWREYTGPYGPELWLTGLQAPGGGAGTVYLANSDSFQAGWIVEDGAASTPVGFSDPTAESSSGNRFDLDGEGVLSIRDDLVGEVLSYTGGEWALTGRAVSAPRFQSSPDWRIGIADLDSNLITLVETIATEKSGQRRRREPGSFSFRVPADNPQVSAIYDLDGFDDPVIEAARRIVYVWRRDFQQTDVPWSLVDAYVLANTDDEGDENDTSTACQCLDAWALLYGRPVITGSGGMPPKAGYKFDATPGSTIVQTLINDSISFDGEFFIDAFSGTIEETTNISISFDQGTTIGEALEKIAATETLDISFRPVRDPGSRPGIIAELNVASRRGADKPSLIWAYGMATETIRRVRRTTNGTPKQLANDVRLFGGPGGQYVAGTVSQDATSISRHRRYVAVDFLTDVRKAPLLAELADEELAFRKEPQESLAIVPANDAGPRFLNDYDVGDSITVWIGPVLRRAEQGLQRLNGIDWTVDNEDNEIIEQLLVGSS